MLIEETLRKMLALKMPAMATATRELLESAASNQLSFEDRLGIIIDREWTERDSRRVARRIREAKLSTRVSLEAVECDASRGLDKSFIKLMSTCNWIGSHHNVLITGATGTGKSFLGAALAEAACRHGFRAFFVRVPRLVEELAIARAAGTYASTLVGCRASTCSCSMTFCLHR
jgi:DNA replication protein DnaC